MTVIAELRLRCTATAYCIVDSSAEGQWPAVGKEGISTRVTATVFLLNTIDSNSPHGRLRELHRDNGISDQVKFDTRREGLQIWEEWQTATAGPVSPKKRKADTKPAIPISVDALLHAIEDPVKPHCAGHCCRSTADQIKIITAITVKGTTQT
jgi:hypothetical protein